MSEGMQVEMPGSETWHVLHVYQPFQVRSTGYNLIFQLDRSIRSSMIVRPLVSDGLAGGLVKACDP